MNTKMPRSFLVLLRVFAAACRHIIEEYASAILHVEGPIAGGNATHTLGEPLENNREYRFNLPLRLSDEQVADESSLDDKPLLAWRGELAQAKDGHARPYPFIHRSLVIGAFAGTVRFRSVRVRALE
jgi:hypothetical protein